MSNRTISPTVKVLLMAREFLSNKDNWCPEGEGRNGVDGHRRCAIQALNHVYLTYHTQSRAIHESLGRLIEAANRLIGYDAVMHLYDLAITEAMQEENIA